jgi:autotransporter-associated beta strand protein
LFASAYHFDRADIGGNTGANEATHFLQQAGAFMRPGYLLPVLDLEAGNTQHSTTSLSNWAVSFSDTIYNATGVRPIVYVNSSYANSEVNSSVAASMPNLWIARPAGAVDPLTGEPPPAVGYPNVYGVWNPTYPNTPDPEPWKFWQYSTSGGIPGFSGNIDKNAANGGIEFVKDFLIPAMWLSNSSGEWTTLANWNSGQAPTLPPGPPTVPSCGTCPVGTTGQLAPIGTQTFPTPRAPGDTNATSTSGEHDTVIIDRTGASVTVTHSSGAHEIRKLLMREALNVTGGSLTISYDPASWDFDAPSSLPVSARFSGPVALSGSGVLSVHTAQLDAGQTLTLGGGTLAFHQLNLISHSLTKISVMGDANVNPLNDATATITRSASTGTMDLMGGTRQLTVGDGAADVDLAVAVPIINGGLTKAGAGTMRLDSDNTFAGNVAITGGTLRYGHESGLNPASLVTIENTGRLDMNGFNDTIAGLVSGVGQTTGVVQQGAGNLTLSSNGGDDSFYGSITGSGTLTKTGTSIARLRGSNTLGPVNVNSGSLLMYGANTTGNVTLNGGTFGGPGSVTGSVTANSGSHIAPGASIGNFNVGPLTLNAGSQLDFELGSSGVGDRILVNGPLTLNGGVVDLTNISGSFTPFSFYTLITFSSLVGDVANLTANGPAGFDYQLVQSGNSVSLAVLPQGVSGDFNDDGMVDAADYVVWRKFFDVDIDLPNDEDLPGPIGTGEHDMWYQNFSRSEQSGHSGQVPEPTAMVLLVLGMIGLVVGRRFRGV